MERIERYETEPYRQTLDSRVLETGCDRKGNWVRLEETIFYPEGGGQPADRGRIKGRDVIDIQKDSQGSRHYVREELHEGPVTLELDWARRWHHMQQHTAQHLITALAADLFGWQTTSFHLGTEQSDIELEVKSISQTELQDLEERVAKAVRAALSVSARRVGHDEFKALDVRTRGLPKGHTGSIRLVEIAGIDLNTCGGTHLSSTSELEAVKLLGTEAIRDQTRVYYVAGERLRRRLATHESILSDLRRQLDSGNRELANAVQRSLNQNRAASREIKALEDELAASQVNVLLNRPERIVSQHYEGRALPFMQHIGRRIVDRHPGRIVLLTSSQAGSREGLFLLAAGEGSGLKLQEAGQRIAELLEGRGGGRPPIFQGKAARIDRRDEALAELVSF